MKWNKRGQENCIDNLNRAIPALTAAGHLVLSYQGDCKEKYFLTVRKLQIQRAA